MHHPSAPAPDWDCVFRAATDASSRLNPCGDDQAPAPPNDSPSPPSLAFPGHRAGARTVLVLRPANPVQGGMVPGWSARGPSHQGVRIRAFARMSPTRVFAEKRPDGNGFELFRPGITMGFVSGRPMLQ